MSKENIESLFSRIRAWPEDWQEEAVGALLRLEHDYENPYELTEEDEKALDEAVARADRREFVSHEEMKAFFAKLR